MSIRAIIRRYRDRPLGQSLVEFALILPVFLVIVSTAVDLGRIAYARVTIANVAREASFEAAQDPTAYQAGQPCDPDANRVICRAILESKGSVVTVTPADIALACDPTCSEGLGNTVTVTATGRFNLLTPVMAVFFGGTTITFSSSATNQISTLPSVNPTAAPTPTPSPTPDPSASVEPTVTPAPTPTPVPDCSGVSAGFTYVTVPADDVLSPVTVYVTDSTTWNTACTTVWAWDWGDGATTYGRLQGPHTYVNAGPGNKRYILSLTVTSGTFTTTVGGYAITVKP